MRFMRNIVLGTLILLIFCGVMVVRQFVLGDSEHIERRESFFLLVKKGYNVEAGNYYESLLINLQDLSDKTLVADLQRAAMLVDTTKTDTENLIWRFYWSINKELEKRAEIRVSTVLQNAETN